MASRGFVLWFTGLSGSGKSTLASMVAAELRSRGVHVETLDGDEIRKQLSRGLGFSREDRDENIRRIGFAAKLVSRSGACAIAAAISPYRSVRDEVRQSVDRFVEIYTECPVPVLAERDPKGLYKKALAGTIKNFTGVDDPYEAPVEPEVHLHTDREGPEQSLAKIVARLEALGFIRAFGAQREAAKRDTLSLPLPYGQELVDRFVDAHSRVEAVSGAPATIDLDEPTYADLVAIGAGAYSPLRGFMTSKDYLRVVRERRLEQGLPWAFPITLEVPEDRSVDLRAGHVVLLRRSGRPVGTLHVDDVWHPDREAEAGGTSPAAGTELRRSSALVGGDVECFESADVTEEAFPRPRTVRNDLVQRGFRRVTAIRADAPPFASDEYRVRAALEFSDGVIVLCAADAHRGIPARVIVRCYEALFDRYFARERVRALPYPWSKQGDPLGRTLHDAIVARNFGASRLVVVPDGFGDPAEAVHGLGELGIDVVTVAPGTWSREVGAATSRTAPEGTPSLDVDSVLESVRQGGAESPLVRPEVAEVLRGHFTSGHD